MNIEKNSIASVSTAPLSSKMLAGNSCINLGAGNGLDLIDTKGEVTIFSTKNNAAIAIAVDGDTLRFAEVVSCSATDYIAAEALVTSTLGKVVVGASIVAGGAVINNNMGSNNNAGGFQASFSSNQ